MTKSGRETLAMAPCNIEGQTWKQPRHPSHELCLQLRSPLRVVPFLFIHRWICSVMRLGLAASSTTIRTVCDGALKPVHAVST